jgi:hypothetical protein
VDNATKTKLALEIQRLVDKAPKDTWGGSESYEQGLDCSGALYFACRRAGLLVSRTTARNMEMGRCGWDSIPVELRDTQDLDIWWWTFASKPDRINGHVGIAHGWKDGYPAVVHASQSRGRVVQDAIKGWVINDCTSLRRLK